MAETSVLQVQRAALYETLDYRKYAASIAKGDSSGVSCTCSNAAAEALGGAQGLLAHCPSAGDTSRQAAPPVHPVQLHGISDYAAQSGACSDSLGVMLEGYGGSWRSRMHTEHYMLQAHPSGTISQPLSAQQTSDENLKRSLQEDKQWRLQCIFRDALPWDVADGPHLLTFCNGKFWLLILDICSVGGLPQF